MIHKRPHNAVIKWKPAPTADPATGLKSESPAVEHPVKCRFAPAGNGEFTAADGNSQLKYGFKVYLDPLEFEIPENAVIVWLGDEYSITRVDPLQMGTLLWL
jgi:hypothetical protein